MTAEQQLELYLNGWEHHTGRWFWCSRCVVGRIREVSHTNEIWHKGVRWLCKQHALEELQHGTP